MGVQSIVAAIVAVFISAPGFAQTQPTRPSAYATASTMPSAFATAPLNPCYPSSRDGALVDDGRRGYFNPTSPCYSGNAYAYYSAVPVEPSDKPAPKERIDISQFNEQDVRERMKAKGYDKVAELQKDNRGIWRGQATLRDGRSAEVILDLDGNIYSQLLPQVDIRIRDDQQRKN